MTDTLPPLPELPTRRIRHVYNESKGYECDCWTAEMVRAYAVEYAAAAVQAEREACEKEALDADDQGSVNQRLMAKRIAAAIRARKTT